MTRVFLDGNLQAGDVLGNQVTKDGKKYKVWQGTTLKRRPGGNKTNLYQPVDEEIKEFAPDGSFKPPAQPKKKGDDPWGNDDRSKIISTVRDLIKAGNKVDWRVPGQMGHVQGVRDDDWIILKRWGMPYSKIRYTFTFRDDRDNKYQIVIKSPKHYEGISA